jgi:hypothetical protein
LPCTWETCFLVRAMARRLGAFRGHGDLLGHGPQKARACSGHGHDALLGVLAAGAQAARACAQPSLRLPTDGLDRFGALGQPAWPVAADLRGIPGGPGPVAQGTPGLGGASWGEGALAAPLPTEICCREQAHILHAWSGMCAAGQGTQCGHGRDGDGARPCSCSSGSRRWRRAVGAVTARPSAWKTIGCAGVAPTPAESQRRGAGPQGAWPGERLACHRQKAVRRTWAALRSQRASARARQRSRVAASATGGTETGVRAPERLTLAHGSASRRSVWTRSPGFVGMREGAIPHQSSPWLGRER